jgi:hypothetical protein
MPPIRFLNADLAQFLYWFNLANGTPIWAGEPYDLARCPNIVKYLARIGARPA